MPKFASSQSLLNSKHKHFEKEETYWMIPAIHCSCCPADFQKMAEDPAIARTLGR